MTKPPNKELEDLIATKVEEILLKASETVLEDIYALQEKIKTLETAVDFWKDSSARWQRLATDVFNEKKVEWPLDEKK